MRKYKVLHSSILLSTPTIPTNDCNQITDAGIGVEAGQILYGVPVSRKRMGAGIQNFIHIANPTHISGKEILGYYVPANAVQDMGRKAAFSAEGDAPPVKLISTKFGNAMIGAGLLFGFGSVILSYNKLKNMDWESADASEQGKAVGSALGYITGALITIGMGYGIALYSQSQIAKEIKE